MSLTLAQIVGGVLGVTLVLWMLGAYNRLVRLRSAILAAWTQIDDQLRRRGETLPPLLQALRESLPDEQAGVDAVAAALAKVHSACDVVRGRPTRAAAVARLAQADGELGIALAALQLALGPQAALRDQEQVAGWARALHEADQRDSFARQLFNDAVDAYNRAAFQYPTRLLMPVFGFAAAGRVETGAPVRDRSTG